MSLLDALTKRIISGCEQHGVVVSNALAAFAIKASVLRLNLKLDSRLSDDQLTTIALNVMELLTNVDSPVTQTFQMQLKDHEVRQNRNNGHLEEKEHMSRTVDQLFATFTTLPITDMDEIASYVQQIVYVQLGLAPTIPNHRDKHEIDLAIESVIPRSTLRSFLKLPTMEQKEQLGELALIVDGIRILNKCTVGLRKGDATEGLLPDSTAAYIERTLASVHAEIDATRAVAGTLSSVAAWCQDTHTEPECGSTQRIIDELSNREQLLEYYSKIINTCHSLQEELAEVTPDLDEKIRQLATLVSQRTSVPKREIYPEFVALAQYWAKVKDINDRAVTEGRTFTALRELSEQLRSRLTERDIENSRDHHLQLPDAPPAKAIQWTSGQSGETEAVILDRSVALDVPLSFNGFDIYMIVERGILARARRDLGVVQLGKVRLGFSEPQTLGHFMQAPMEYVDRLLTTAKEKPELIHLLDLVSFYPMTAFRNAEHSYTAQKARGAQEFCMQTEVHPIESFKDPKYKFSLWEHRRDALKLLRLMKCRTVSTQTPISSFRRTAETQVWEARSVEIQTMTDRTTQPPHMRRYLAGLRGDPNAKFEAVEFEVQY